jgi:hypothetical protein
MQVVETLQKMDFATQYQPRKEIVHNGAMLAISVVLVSNENKSPTLEMPCSEGISVRMNLTQELILALCNMLQLTSKEAVWNIGAPSQTQAEIQLADVSGEKKVLH